MSPNIPNPKPQKPQAVIPTTEISQEEERSTRRFVFWSIVVTIVALIAGGVLLYWLIGRYIKQSNLNKAQDYTIGLLKQKKTDLEALRPNYEKVIAPQPGGQSQKDSILIAVPTDEAYEELIAMIENMSQQSGVQVSSISKGEASKATENGYQFTVSMTGTFNQILDFVSKTEDSARVMDFVSMNISGSTREGETTVSAVFQTYFNPKANISPKQVPLNEYIKTQGGSK